MTSIEVIDFSCLSVNIPYDKLNNDVIEDTSQKLVDCFQSLGVVYLKNTGLDFNLIRDSFDKANDFFGLPHDVKTKYKTDSDDGYVEFGQESHSGLRHKKEIYNTTAEMYTNEQYPTEIPELDSVSKKLFGMCINLSERIYKGVAVGLKLKDSEFFLKRFNIGNNPNNTVLHYLRYPSLDHAYVPGEVRLEEHTDVGSFALIFQGAGATPLQFKTTGGKWIEATPVQDTVLVIVSDLMQMWTADKLRAPPHLLPEPVEDVDRRKPRQSIVFFVLPDSNTLVECLDGSKKYPPITAGEHLKSRINPFKSD